MAGVAVAIGFAAAGGSGPGWFAAPLAAVLVAGFGNTLNDIVDVELDRRAHPERPLPSGRITLSQAQAFAAALLLFGLWSAYTAGGIGVLLFASVNAVVLAGYEWRFKSQPLVGNVVVAALVGSAFVFGGFAADGPLRIPLLMGGLAAGASLARELVKDVEDVAADAAYRRTLPVVFGARATLVLAFIAVVVPVAATVAAFDDLAGPDRGIILVAADALLVVGAGLAFQHPGRGQRILKVGMVVALLAFVLAV